MARRKKDGNGNGGNGHPIEPTADETRLAHAIAHALKPAFDGLEKGLGARIDNLGTKIDSMGSRLEAKLDSMGTRLEAKVDSMGTRLEAKVDALILLSAKD